LSNWSSPVLPVEPLAVGSDENHHADYRALLCQ
jgi:hypothetical protein